MRFKTFQFIFEKDITGEEVNKIASEEQLNFEYGSDIYLIDSEIINNSLIWLYCQYDNKNLYGEIVFDTSSHTKSSNQRKKTQVELRGQLFIIIDLENHLLFINDINKKGFIKHFLSERLQKNVYIKYIYSSLEEFENSIKCLTGVKFTQERNIASRTDPDSIFMKSVNELGLDFPNKLTMKIDYGKKPIALIRKGLKGLKEKRNLGYFSDIVVTGLDDDNIEQHFDFRTLVKSITISVEKNENEQYDEIEIKKLIIEKIRSINV